MSSVFSPSFSACITALLVALVVPQSPALWAHAFPRGAAAGCDPALGSVRVARTEVFLGLSRPDGSLVSDAAFDRFVETEVSPRLPGGFTVVPGSGRFRDASGAIVSEPARVVVVLHPLDSRRGSEGIEQIRTAYRKAFDQASVLRVDGESCASP